MPRLPRQGCGPVVLPPVGVVAGLAQTINVPVLNNQPTFTTNVVTNSDPNFFEVTTPDTAPIRCLKTGLVMIEARIQNWNVGWPDLRAFQTQRGGSHTGTVRVGSVLTVNGAYVSDVGYFAPAAGTVVIKIMELCRVVGPGFMNVGLDITHLSGATRALNLALYAWYIGIDS